jgi:DNA-binding response OmpR family regulator
MESQAAPSNSIMIINDNLDLLNLFKDALQQEGFEPYTFTDPSFALRKIKLDPHAFSLAIINYSTQLKKSIKRIIRE